MSEVPDFPAGIGYTVQEAAQLRENAKRLELSIPDPYVRDLFLFLLDRAEQAPGPDIPAIAIQPGYGRAVDVLEELKKSGKLDQLIVDTPPGGAPDVGAETEAALQSADPSAPVQAWVRSRGESGMRIVFRPGLRPKHALHWLQTLGSVLFMELNNLDPAEVTETVRELLKGKIESERLQPPPEEPETPKETP